jgi:hypothetical protein
MSQPDSNPIVPSDQREQYVGDCMNAAVNIIHEAELLPAGSEKRHELLLEASHLIDRAAQARESIGL